MLGECRVQFVDSHTEGEPTRVVIAGGPDLGEGPLAERCRLLRSAHDSLRRQVVTEPRGSDVLVGALLCEPDDQSCDAGVIFFNNAGYLGMCGHGAIGVVATLHYLGQIAGDRCRLQTPVGVVEAHLKSPHEVTIENVASYRLHKQLEVMVDGLGTIAGDVAWGGNWFFLCNESPVPVQQSHIVALTDAAWRIRRALAAAGITGAEGAEIDHIELFGPSDTPGVDSRNFVLCPGGAYDRSPCGTGTSAKLACLAGEQLAPGQQWVQESIIGSRFTATYRIDDRGAIVPSITGRSFICGQGQLIGQSDDPFRFGIPAGATE
jgi:4-hydroxyproline epimerase